MRSYYRQWSNTESEKTVIKLPVKWMALESLHDGLFSEKTDVVSGLYFLKCLSNYTVVIWCVMLGGVQSW